MSAPNDKLQEWGNRLVKILEDDIRSLTEETADTWILYRQLKQKLKEKEKQLEELQQL